MEIEIKVISKEIIKPSSPTPKPLKKYQLSLLDQLAPPIFPHFVYFYQSNPRVPNSQKSDNLKKSLSETLSRFYPLAGRLVGNLYVNCNDAGVPFVEAEADFHLSIIIANKDPKFTHKVVPNNLEEYALKGLSMAVQTTYFRCGGVAVAYIISHKLADGLSSVMFAKVWSAVAKNGSAAVHHVPEFDAATYFPPRDISGFKPTTGMVKEDVVGRIFTFPAAKIAALQERYSRGGRRPSRVAAVSAFICTQLVPLTTRMKPDPSKIYTVVNAVNLRTRADPPLSGYLFGNVYGISVAKVAAGDGGVEVVRKVEDAKKAVDGGYVAWVRKGESLLNMMKEMMAVENRNEMVWFNFSSICGFALYEMDFGWGRPVRVGHGGFPVKNLITLTDNESGDGIEVLVNLTKGDMEKFTAHLELGMLMSNL